MSGKEHHEVASRIALRGGALACLLAAALAAVRVGSAQSTPAQTAPAPPPAAAAAQNSAAKPPAPKSPSEGIRVHGHWAIDVKNPDGTVVTHRAFENKLQSGGMNLLSVLLAGQYTAGGWELVLCKTGGAQTCALPAAATFVLVIGQSGTGIASNCQNQLVGTNTYECFPDLSPTLGQSTFQLSATVTNTLEATIPVDTVESDLAGCFTQGGNGTPSQTTTMSPSTCLTDANFPSGQLSGTANILQFTGAGLSTVQVGPGQSIAVNVTFSFQ
jgi:hypothetical protein